MNLKRNNQVKVTSWYNTDLICNQNWHVYSSEADNEIYIVVKDPMTNTELKIKIEKLP